MTMNELKQKRKKLGLTQAQAAEACGVSRRTYQTYEEQEVVNKTFEKLRQKLNDLGVLDNSNYVLSLKYIKKICTEVFSAMYPQVKAAYLFGSYSRGEATGKSDVDILVVLEPMGMEFYGMVAELEDRLHKQADVHTHRQLMRNEVFAEEVLKDGIKLYKKESPNNG